jgi:hypothetical protein
MTPQQIDAMKLALEALKANYLLVNGTETHGGLEQCLDGYYSSCFDTDPINKQTEEAITALEEALAEHAMQEVQRLGQEIEQCQCPKCQIKPHASDCAVHSEPAYPKGKCDCKAQPEQEPVAWLHNFIDGGISIGKRPADLERHPDRWTALYKDPKPCPTCEALARTVMLDQTSHDTTPPQRTWVGLTEQDLDYLCNLAYTGDEEFALAVQAKLMEKNA